AVLPIISIFEFLPQSGIDRQGEFRAVAMINMTRYTIGNGAMLGFAFSGHSYMSLAYGQLVSGFVAAIAANILGWRHASVRLGGTRWREIMVYGIQVLASTGIGAVSARIADLIMGRLLGLAALGLFSRASGLNSLIIDNFYLIIVRVVFVDLAEQ